MAFHWYARFPMTEIPALALLAGGIWLWAVAAPARATYAAGVAGFLLGLTFLMRPDGLFTVGAVALLAAWLLATGRFDRPARALVLATAVTAAVTFAHVGRFAWTYFAGNWERHAHAVAIAAPVVAVVLAVVALVAARRRAAVDGMLRRHEATVGRGLAIVAGGGLALLLVAGRLLDWNGATWLTWYATWPGLVLAVGGLAVAVPAGFRRDRGAVLLLPVALLLGTVAIYGVDARVAPDHFWAIRRFVSAALPLLAVFAGLAVAAAWSRPRLRAGVLALLGVTVALGVYDLWPALRFDEYRGSTAALAQLDAKLGEPETLVITPWLAAPDGRYGVPLRVRFHRAAVPVFRLDRQPLAAWVTDQVARRPVRMRGLLRPRTAAAARPDRRARERRDDRSRGVRPDRQPDSPRRPPPAHAARDLPARGDPLTWSGYGGVGATVALAGARRASATAAGRAPREEQHDAAGGDVDEDPGQRPGRNERQEPVPTATVAHHHHREGDQPEHDQPRRHDEGPNAQSIPRPSSRTLAKLPRAAPAAGTSDTRTTRCPPASRASNGSAHARDSNAALNAST